MPVHSKVHLTAAGLILSRSGRASGDFAARIHTRAMYGSRTGPCVAFSQGVAAGPARSAGSWGGYTRAECRSLRTRRSLSPSLRRSTATRSAIIPVPAKAISASPPQPASQGTRLPSPAGTVQRDRPQRCRRREAATVGERARVVRTREDPRPENPAEPKGRRRSERPRAPPASYLWRWWTACARRGGAGLPVKTAIAAVPSARCWR